MVLKLTSEPAPNYVPEGFPKLPVHWKSESGIVEIGESDQKIFAQHAFLAPGAGGVGASAVRDRVLVVLHGQGEHGGRYQHFAHFLDGRVGHLLLIDHRGHGRSTGQRGHVDRFDDYVDDAATTIQLWLSRLETAGRKLEVHLFGHSMGGLIALRLLTQHPELGFKSAAISSPLLALKMKVPPVKKGLAIGISRIWGTLAMKNEISPQAISHDPFVQRAYVDDKLNHNRVTPKFFVELQKAMADTLAHGLDQYPCPVIFFLPLQDPIVDTQVTQGFVARLQMEKPRYTETKTYPDFFHESFNETAKEIAFEDLRQWIQVNAQN